MSKDDVVEHFAKLLVREIFDGSLRGTSNYIDGSSRSAERKRALEESLTDDRDRRIFVAQLACYDLMHALLIMIGCDNDSVKLMLRDDEKDGEWFDITDVWYGEELAANFIGEEGWLDRYSDFPEIFAHEDAPEVYGRKMAAALHAWRTRKLE